MVTLRQFPLVAVAFSHFTLDEKLVEIFKLMYEIFEQTVKDKLVLVQVPFEALIELTKISLK